MMLRYLITFFLPTPIILYIIYPWIRRLFTGIISKMEFQGSDLLKLAELLKPVEPEADQATCEVKHENEVISKNDQLPKSLEEFEIQQERELKEYTLDDRKGPKFDMKYRQAVSAEDIFLQMGMKTPCTSSCEDMIITIELPGEKYSALDLNLSSNDLKLEGFHYKLHLPLPHTIDPDASNAKWNQNAETLVLTLRLRREFDYVNF